MSLKIKSIHLPTIDSTNNWVKKHLNELDPKMLTCVTADEQSSGRGRFRRKWESKKGGGIYATYYFSSPLNNSKQHNLGQLLSLVTVQVLIKLGFNPKIKWPNDLLIDNKKLGGVLCEIIKNKEYYAVILGIGVNVNISREDLNHLDQAATSLSAEKGGPFKIGKIVIDLTRKFNQVLEIYQKEGFKPFLKEYENHLVFGTEPLTFYNAKQKYEGTFDSINEEGFMNLKLTNGDIKMLISGDISKKKRNVKMKGQE